MTKAETVQHYARQYGFRLFIETGTFGGDMVEAMIPYAQIIFTIEIDFRMNKEARERFDKVHKVVCLLGDSAVVLPNLLNTFPTSVMEGGLFWLDGHYSGAGTARGPIDSPVRAELLAIRDWRYGDESMILCDDAGMFQGVDGYPTIEEVKGLFPDRRVEVVEDIIRIYPCEN